MPVIHDTELGQITVRRTSSRSRISFSMSPGGDLRVSVPKLMPMFMVKRTISLNKKQMLDMRSSQTKLKLHDGMMIGKRHTLQVRSGPVTTVRRSGYQVIVQLPANSGLNDTQIIDLVRPYYITCLRREAKEHLPGRIRLLSEKYSLPFSALRYSHASSRWGSCNSNKSISLNIGLMQLPFELIDYVLVHELAHTKELNHSERFWDIVKKCEPRYKEYRLKLKDYSPSVG